VQIYAALCHSSTDCAEKTVGTRLTYA